MSGRRLGPIAACMALAWFLAVPLASATPRDPARAAAGVATLTLASQPVWVDPAKPSEVSVRVTNAPRGSTVHAELHDQITTRAALHSTEPGTQTKALCTRSSTAVTSSDLGNATSGTVTVQVRLTTDPPQLDHGCHVGDGVYPVSIQLRDDDGSTVGDPLVTYLLMFPHATGATDPAAGATAGEAGEGSTALGVALVLPVGDKPTVAIDGSRAIDRATRERIGTMVDALQGPDGSIGNENYPVTFRPVPDTLDALRASPSLRNDVVDTLTATGRQVIAGPYVPIDQPSMSSDARLRRLVDDEVAAGRTALADVVTSDASAWSTWFANDDLDDASLPVLQQFGVRRLLVPDDALADTRSTMTSTEPFTLEGDTSGELRAVAVDSRLGDDLTGADQRLGVQRTLADLALVAHEAQGTTREPSDGVVLAPPRNWSPTAANLRLLLKALHEVPTVLRPVTVSQLFGSTSDAPGKARSRELDGGPRKPAAYVAAVTAADSSITSYQSVVAPATTPGADASEASRRVSALALRRRTSAYEGFSASTQRRYLEAIANDVHAALGKVSVPGGQKVTLTARTGKVPFTIRNDTGLPIDVVVVAEGSERVKFESPQEQAVHVDGTTARVDMKVHVRTSGDIPIRIRLLTPQGGVQLSSGRITVRSTVVSGVGLVLTIGALVFLVGWWISHWRSNRRPPKGRHARARRAST